MNLSEEVQNKIIEMDHPSVDDLSVAVFEGLNPSDYGDALQQTLPQFISIEVAKFNNAFKPDKVNRTAPVRIPKTRKTRIQRGREKEEKEVGRWHRRWLYGVEWVYFKDATVEDLFAAAGRRRKQADGLIAAATRLEVVANLMNNRDVDTAGEISEDELDALLEINDVTENDS